MTYPYSTFLYIFNNCNEQLITAAAISTVKENYLIL